MKLNALKPFFPQAFAADNTKSLGIAVLIYVAIAFVVSLVIGFLSWIPILGFVLSILGWLINLYCVAGIILAILVFLKVIQ